MDVIRDEEDWKLINFQLLVLFSLFTFLRVWGESIADVELLMAVKLNG
jgi:hypothetical protein